MKYIITMLRLFERRIKQSIFLLILFLTILSCKKEQTSTPIPTPPVVVVPPPVDLGKVTATTAIPVVLNNKTITFSVDVVVVAPATVYNKYLVINWYNDSLRIAETQTVNSSSFTKTDCIPGTKYTVKAVVYSSRGTIYTDTTFATSTGFHMGQTFNGFKVWDVWSNADSAQLVGNLLARKYSFGCQGTSISGTSANFGTGMANTLKINAICPTNSAANLCLNDTVLGSGSYLGSREDWLRFFQNKDKANIQLEVSGIWTSTEENAVYAWMIRISDGATIINAKMNGGATVPAGPGVYAFKKVGK
jgi:hypothetical protein